MTYILAAIIVVLAIVIISAGVKVVPQSETRVIERLGRPQFHHTVYRQAKDNLYTPCRDNRRRTLFSAQHRDKRNRSPRTSI